METLTRLARDAGRLIEGLPAWAEAALVLASFAAAGLLLHGLAVRIIRATIGRRLGALGRGLLDRVRPPTRLALVVVLVAGTLPATPLAPETRGWIAYGLLLAFVVVLGWAAAVAVNVSAEIYLRRLPLESEGRHARPAKAQTQVRLLRRIAVILVGFLTVAALLTTSPVARQYGTSLFASAGVAGLVIGLAAQPVLSNVIAGLQIAITQPMRIDDAVIVEGEFGFIEDIRTSYVIVRLWDLRRLIVPLKRFIEQPFQNWTRDEHTLIGSVHWYLDYSTPVDAVRERFEALVRASPLWDGENGRAAGRRRRPPDHVAARHHERAQPRRGLGPALRGARADDRLAPGGPSRRPAAGPRPHAGRGGPAAATAAPGAGRGEPG